MRAYKKVTRDFKEYILTLEIPEFAQRGKDINGNLRVDMAYVVEVECMDGSKPKHTVFHSLYDWSFFYEVGTWARTELTRKGGIHCTLKKEDARAYMLGKLVHA